MSEVQPGSSENSEGAVEAAVDALLPAFGLGATDAAEAALVMRNLGGNAAAASEVAAYSKLCEGLLYTVAPAAPPPALAERLRAALTVGQGVSAPAKTAQLPPPSTPAPTASAPKAARRWLWPTVAAAAALLLLASINVYLLREVAALRTDQAALRATATEQATRLAAQEAQLAEQHRLLAEQDALVAKMVSSEGERYVMNAAQEGSQALAEVAWLFDQNVAVLRATGFPALEPGRVYQLWLIRNGERTSGGTFVVDAAGTGTFVFTPPESLDNFEGMGITPEPEGGSPRPTAPPVVRAQL